MESKCKSSMKCEPCVIDKTLEEYSGLLNGYLDKIFSIEDLSDLSSYNDVSKNIHSMHIYAKKYRLELIQILIDRQYVKFVLQMMDKLKDSDIFENDDKWNFTRLTYEIHCNFSDVSKCYSRELLKYGIADLLITNIGLENVSKNDRVEKYVKISLSVFHHIVKYQETDMLLPFKKKYVREKILELVQSENQSIKGHASLIFAYIFDEEEQESLSNVNCSVKLFKECLENAMKILDETVTRRSLGFTVVELVQGVAALAVNDKLKKSMDETGFIPLLVKLVKEEKNEDEKIPAIKALWNLSFDKTICEKLIKEYDIMSILNKCVTSENSTIVKLSKGALWKLKENSLQLESKSENNKSVCSNAFISYSWEDKEIVVKIVQDLKRANICVWIDAENAKGSILDAMAEGIEKCAAVIIFMSEKYKGSPNCRSEAEYAYKLNKPIVPVIVEKNYKPNGWLGIILRARLYYDFSENCDYDTTIKKMIRNLNDDMDPKIVSATVATEGSTSTQQNLNEALDPKIVSATVATEGSTSTQQNFNEAMDPEIVSATVATEGSTSTQQNLNEAMDPEIVAATDGSILIRQKSTCKLL